ncbi:hypothetical protein CXB51_035978 [Gossypium anomalum]|uniref:Cytochrome P450 n=1 Tax=Gossypium anomalum TaxID=47600 RepID=A0A8J5Y8I5_9ROSI|nr:hypothetical protein CXB51_035978 [Gossypium anomalum]
MNSQSIRGPPYEFIHGNNKAAQMLMEASTKPMALTHDILPRVMPHVYSWIDKYGKTYLSWNGIRAQLLITDPELVKENMIPAVVASVETMLEKWKSKEGKEMEVFQEFRLLTSEVISRTAFGSSYLEGEKIFDMLMKLSVIAGRNIFKAKIPIIREDKVVTGEADNFGRDFLGLLVNAYHEAEEKNRLSIQDLVDECKTSYFSGQETVNSLLAWATLLLAIHSDWQDKARAEVIEVFDTQNPDSEGMAKLNTITMIINETLRLYPPISGVIRKVGREVRLGTLVLPTHSEVDMRIIALHHDPDLWPWGDDVDLFKPERFAEGIAEATNCIYALRIGTSILRRRELYNHSSGNCTSMILQRYTINLSPSYVHAPLQRLTLRPQHGIQLLKRYYSKRRHHRSRPYSPITVTLQNLIGEDKKMETMGYLLILFTASLCLYLFVALLNVFYKYWWIPHQVQFILNSQGIRGPPYEFIHGNNKEAAQMLMEASTKPLALTHDIFPRVMPHVYSWINKYGKTYLSWNGIRAQLLITDPELVKEVLKNSDKAFPKPKRSYFIDKLIGDGLASTESEKWARQRKLANYAFHGESLKNMTPAVVASVETRDLNSEVISRTAFGSSYLEGEKIFDMLMKLSVIAGRNIFKEKIPIISKFWKSADEIESERIAKMIHDSVMSIVKKREERVVTGEADNFGCDFLGLLVNAYHEADEKNRLSIQDLVDECKTFYFGGQETVNSLLAWATLLLAIHSDWQDRARAEVIEVFGNQNPDSEGMAKLKTITMIINETLRLYPPLSGVIREVGREVQLGKLVLPTRLEVEMRIIALHHDPDLWGDDVNLFKPERFAEGIAKATKYNAAAFMPFGLGPRSCVGMSFAITEAKTALSMILQRYTVTVSRTYVHAPAQRLTLKPQHGIQLLFHSLNYDI